MWERFFNWQSDQDWTWGPFLPLRPARDTPIRPWVWARLFLALSLAGLLGLTLLGVVSIWEPRLAARQHWTMPPGVGETLGTLKAMGNDPATQALLIGLGLSLPLVFALACLPFHVAWNRRAARLARMPAADTKTVGGTTSEDVWPPAPNTR